jgi:hypothetical protein
MKGRAFAKTSSQEPARLLVSLQDRNRTEVDDARYIEIKRKARRALCGTSRDLSILSGGGPNMDPDEYKKTIEEFKELGLEYRYKDQMMVQELGFVIITLGVVVNGLLSARVSWGYLCIQVIVGFFAVILARHLAHINQDRCEALERKEKLRGVLGFGATHLGTDDKRLSAPRTMVWFAMWLVPVWWIWCCVTFCKLLCP